MPLPNGWNWVAQGWWGLDYPNLNWIWVDRGYEYLEEEWIRVPSPQGAD